MDCKVHGKPMQNVCGEFRCGACYEADLLTNTRVPKRDDDGLTFGLVTPAGGHGKRIGVLNNS